MYSVLEKLILYSFLIFLNKVLEFLNFLNDLVFVSYKPVSYKIPCKCKFILLSYFITNQNRNGLNKIYYIDSAKVNQQAVLQLEYTKILSFDDV